MHKRVNKKYANRISKAFYRLFPKLIYGGWADDA